MSLFTVLAAVSLSKFAGAQSLTESTFATGSAVGAEGPQGLVYDGTNIWVSYTNGASGTGASGSSLIVQYNTSGAVLKTYTVAGEVPCLRLNESTGTIWAVQNPNGNSTITEIDGSTGTMTKETFASTSTTRGYECVAFLNKVPYLSYTAPVSSTDATIQDITNSKSPFKVATVLTMGATGTNLATGQTGQATAQHTPHSIRVTPTSTLMLGSTQDGQLIFVTNPGAGNQSVSFLNVIDALGINTSSLLDATYATASKGTFYIADTNSNHVIALAAKGLTKNTLFGVTASPAEFIQIDTVTGIYTPLVTGFGSPHSVIFVQ